MRSAFKVCFSGRTKLLARGKWGEGYKRIDEITVDDEVASRDENDPNGAMVWKKVEELFVRSGFLLNVNIQGRIIETTAEHPFYEYTKGWIEAVKLESNDRVRTDSGWQQVDEVYDTGIYETVYNLRVAEFHTYFVGDETWGFGVWAHNVYDPPTATTPVTKGKKTSGILHVEGEAAFPLMSGVTGPSQAVRGQGLPGFNGNQLTHVEGHAAAHMRINGIKYAVLDISKVPCTKGSGGGCEGLLPAMLPEGASLRVRGPNGYDSTFTGLPD